MPRRYPAGGTYRGQYGAQQPTTQQYESFFNPIPIDFLQQELGRRQGQYDQAFAGTLASQDELAQQQVGMADIASKNQIIQQGMGDIDKLVNEKYGGDWGKASKDIARNVTKLRANPFWNAQKEVEKRRQAFGEQVTKFGPKGMIFGQDPRQLSTVDPETGQIRGMDQFEGRVVEQGEWADTARTLLGGLSADVYERFGLAEGDLQGYIQGTKTTQLTRDKIEKMASDPAIQEAFLREHPEFREGFEQLDPAQKRKFGLEQESLTEAVKQQLIGVSASAETERIEKSITADWRQKAAAENANKTTNPYIPSTHELPVIDRGNVELKDHQKRVNASTHQGSVENLPLTPEEEAQLDEIRNQYTSTDFIDPETGRNLTLETAVNSFMNSRSSEKIQMQLDDYHNELTERFPELKGMNRDEAFTAYENYLTKVSKESRTVKTMVRDDTPVEIKKSLISNINAGNFESFSFVSTGDVFGKKSITEKLGYKDYTELVTALNENEISPRIDFAQAKMVVNLPSKDKKKYKPADIYFSPDIETQMTLDAGQAVTEMFTNAQTYGDETRPIPIPDARGGYTNDAVIVVGEGNIVDGNNKKVYVVDLSDPNSIPRETSLAAVQNHLAGLIDVKYNNLAGKTGNPGKE